MPLTLPKSLRYKFLPPFFSIFIFCCCTCKITPFKDSSKSQEKIKTVYQPILDFMNYRPGMSFADVGAGSGDVTISMSTLMNNSIIYIQEIDSTILNKKNLDKIIDFNSKQAGFNLRTKNKIETAIGSAHRTELPDITFDLIYSNGTVHNFIPLDSLAIDLRKKLKPEGLLFLRDSFKNSKEDYCLKCKKPLLSKDEFLATMKRCGFKLEKQLSNMRGYPIYGFSIAAD